MKLNEMRSLIRMLILENESTVGYKMIFLAGLPGGGKSTLLRELDIEDRFTNCNIDNFFEPRLQDELGTSDLHTPTERYTALKRKVRDEGYQMTPSEQRQFDLDSAIVSKGASLFSDSVSDFRDQVDEICAIGSNFLIDGTSANFARTSKDFAKYTEIGYDCAMIMVDIDVETSQERNLARGRKGGRSIWNSIIGRQGKKMPKNALQYRELFGDDRFFLVSNRGSFEEYKENIREIRPYVESFLGE